jgi:hypothetical protein
VKTDSWSIGKGKERLMEEKGDGEENKRSRGRGEKRPIV